MSFGAEPCELYLVKTDAGGSAALEFQPMQQTLDARDEPALRLRAVGGGVGVSYYLPNSGRAAISIFDAAGRRVYHELEGAATDGWQDMGICPLPARGAHSCESSRLVDSPSARPSSCGRNEVPQEKT